MSQEHLETFMLMSIEKDLLYKVSNDKVIDAVASKSSTLKHVLIS